MRLIQKYLPNPRHTEIHRIFVKADPGKAWDTVRHLDMSKVPFVKLLFDIRTLPGRLKGKLKDKDTGLSVDQITDHGNGFFIAEEEPGKEVVVASAGQFWHLNIPFADVTPEQFIHFDTPGYGKLAWNISVEPYCDGSTIAVELRTTATDELSWKKLNRYYHIIGIGSQMIRRSMMYQLEHLLGKYKRPDDNDGVLPGDERFPDTKYQATHSIDIEAPPSIVWHYLMQLGCDRAGWYSIDALDNDGKPSVDHRVKAWAKRETGDRISATPKADAFFEVYAVNEGKYFIIGGEGQRLGEPFSMNWTFFLEPVGNDATHLITRTRMRSQPPLKEWILGTFWMPPIHAIMQRWQLKNLKNICERDAQMRSQEIQLYEWA